MSMEQEDRIMGYIPVCVTLPCPLDRLIDVQLARIDSGSDQLFLGQGNDQLQKVLFSATGLSASQEHTVVCRVDS